MNKTATKYFLLFISICLLIVFSASARPGGGHSYSGSGNSSGSSSGSSSSFTDLEHSGSLTWFWSAMIIGIPLLIILKILFWKGLASIDFVSKKTLKTYKKENEKIEKAINRLKEKDPNFSKTLFFDFAASVLIKYYTLQNKNEFITLIPFLPAEKIKELQNKKNDYEIREVVIGAMRIKKIQETGINQTIELDIDLNYTKVVHGNSIRYPVRSIFVFSRKIGLLSPEPEKMRELSCLNCGSNIGFSDSGKCVSCGTIIKNGEMQWCVTNIAEGLHIAQKKSELVYYAKEKGTGYPTIYQGSFDNRIKRFCRNHNINCQEWQQKFKTKLVANYFKSIYASWSENNLSKVRNLLTDRLYESFMFWINFYKEKNLNNRLEKLIISKTELVKIEIDKYYESATVRIHASCKDYVVNSDGKVIGGSKSKKRKFSEYWTFIRRTGVELDDYNYGTCPNCGAPANEIIGQSGICKYCNSKISNGDFSWVLSVITQDEVYKG